MTCEMKRPNRRDCDGCPLAYYTRGRLRCHRLMEYGPEVGEERNPPQRKESKKLFCPDCKEDGEGGGKLLEAYVFRKEPTFMSNKKKELVGYYCEECGSFYQVGELDE